MKLQFIMLLFCAFLSEISYAQDNQKYINFVENFTLREFNFSAESEDNYLLFRSKNMFQIKEINEDKISQYEKLETISLKYNNSEIEYSTLDIEDFINSYKNENVNPLLINVSRNKETEKWYRLGNTNYVLIGYPEDRIAKDYNLSIK